MEIRKLTTWQEKLAADRVIATAFLHDWNRQETERERQAEKDTGEEVWAAFDEGGAMTAAVLTGRHTLTFDGGVYPCTELHMVGSLPEARGNGVIRRLIRAILADAREKGELFSMLMPFSMAFYRKFGFELASRYLAQKADIGQFASFTNEYAVRQVQSEEDVAAVRALYERFSLRYNLVSLKGDGDWQYRGDGEFGERGFRFRDREHYTYLFYNEAGEARAYFTFVFVHGPEGPFTGRMVVTDIAFEEPRALRSLFGFIYGLRAKITEVSLSLPTEVDLALFLPEGDKVERKLEGHIMLRVLDAAGVLGALRHPDGAGEYSVRIEDGFLPENTGTYVVRYEDGKAVSVTKGGGDADMTVTEETFCQLAAGLIDLAAAEYRGGTAVRANRAVLEKVFSRKPLFLH